MNRILLLSIISIFYLTIKGNSQFSIDLGPFTKFICTESRPITTFLGDSLTISGGTPPYTYKWETRNTQVYINWRTFIFTASDYLNDTTLANPEVTNFSNDSIFYLYVTDSLGNIAVDSIKMRYSGYYRTLGYYNHNINAGDSIQLNGGGIFGGINPLKYIWRPNHGLTDSTSRNTWAKPTQNINYYLTITDSTGCFGKGPEVHWVTVNHVSLEENEFSSKIKLYPNPASEFISIELEEDYNEFSYSIFDINGKLIEQSVSNSNKININIDSYDSGEYFIIIEASESIGRENFIINK